MVDKSQQVVVLARLGYAVRGVVYVLLGYLALSATERENVSDGPGGMLEYVRATPGGSAILAIAAAGLVGYAIYKLLAALFDTENLGSDIKGAGQRVAYLISAAIYGALSWTALQLAMGSKTESGDRSHDMAEKALTLDLGPIALGIAGLALVVAAAFQAKTAYDRSFMKHISSDAPQATCWIGRIGLATRALVFLLMGWSLLRSGWFANSDEVRSLGQALLDLRESGPVFTVVACGLVLFGVFSILTARYRIIADPEHHIRSKTAALRG